MRNRKGSYTVFLMIFFSSMLILTGAVIAASVQAAVSSTVQHFGRLWGTSILAEYDLNLKDRYGIYAFHGENTLTSEKLNVYAEYSFEGKTYVRFDGAACCLDGYSLASPEVMKAQMKDAVLAGNKPSPMRHAVSEDSVDTGTASYGYRKITSKWILDGLPSSGKREDADITAAANGIKNENLLTEAAARTAVNQYIFTYFQHYGQIRQLGDTYFRNEVEYILCGKPDDEQARKNVKRKLVLLRNALNLTYLYSCSEKREAALALAGILTPGPEAVLTQGVLLELWAYAEAENDIALLYNGYRVPLLKEDRNWALALENAAGVTEMTGSAEPEENSQDKQELFIRPQVDEGADYEAYLRILLNTVPEETRILRAMDLIQINMKYLYCDYFRLKDYYTGLKFSLTVNGVKHEFEETYDRTARSDTDAAQ